MHLLKLEDVPLGVSFMLHYQSVPKEHQSKSFYEIKKLDEGQFKSDRSILVAGFYDTKEGEHKAQLFRISKNTEVLCPFSFKRFREDVKRSFVDPLIIKNFMDREGIKADERVTVSSLNENEKFKFDLHNDAPLYIAGPNEKESIHRTAFNITKMNFRTFLKENLVYKIGDNNGEN